MVQSVHILRDYGTHPPPSLRRRPQYDQHRRAILADTQQKHFSGRLNNESAHLVPEMNAPPVTAAFAPSQAMAIKATRRSNGGGAIGSGVQASSKSLRTHAFLVMHF